MKYCKQVKDYNMNQLLVNLKTKLDLMMKWLQQSGLKRNGEKTELCIFSRTDSAPITLITNNTPIISKPSMNILGVQFYSKLTWVEHVKFVQNQMQIFIIIMKCYYNLLTYRITIAQTSVLSFI